MKFNVSLKYGHQANCYSVNLNVAKPLPVFLVEGIERDICTKCLSEIEKKIKEFNFQYKQ